MDKSPDAFRTISEVADWLGTPTHVLRFWESRFAQVKPVKRAGGRRYYRPTDMELLGGIKKLLHDDGMTIRGVQKLLREEGVRHVAALSPALDTGASAAEDADVLDATVLPDKTDRAAAAPMITDAPQDEVDNVVPLSRTLDEIEPAKNDKPVEAAATKADAAETDTIEDLEDDDASTSAEAAEIEEDAATRTADASADHDAQPDLLRHEDQDQEPETAKDREDTGTAASEAAKPEAAAPRPAIVDIPPDPEDDDPSFPAITDVAALLRKTASAPHSQRPSPAEIQRLYDRLLGLRDRMTANKRN